ncbi:MAG: aminotransferase class I/II-fold pyridoxal phosphate-dependent enzyme [Clostridia bacterium]|nr:aminotransferase class I/II-fold pyridoxal phosphate-dependent enzyme [Clostridia bacterium]
MSYDRLSNEELNNLLESLEKHMSAFYQDKLNLDLSRGKPSREQLDLSNDIFNALTSRSSADSEAGIDCRNYGGLDGIPEAKQLMAGILGCHAADVIVGGNSSLNMMYEVMTHAMLDGVCGSKPWFTDSERKFLCPVPGYDRHFAITEHLGFELVPIPMNADGPDMDLVEKLVSEDESVKGIWCVPKYQNPTGIIFSDDVIKRFANLRPKAADFRIFWDNAYAVHGLYPDDDAPIPDLLTLAAEAGNSDIVYEFCSTSKITFPGAGIAALAASPANLIDLKSFLKIATIGPDKLNQLRTVRYLRSEAGIREHMKKQAAFIRPKFEKVQQILERDLGGTGIAKWTNPRGGYFVSFDTMPGCAAEVVALCGRAGVKFTPAGSTWPHGFDPEDKNIRLAPTYAAADEIEEAMSLFTVAVRIVSIYRILAQRNSQ